MSRNNTSKQLKEMNILKSALSAPMSNKCRKILTGIFDSDAWVDGWKSFDKPDLYKITDSCVIGIEHVSVNFPGIMKKGQFQSLGTIAQMCPKAIMKIYEQYRNLVLNENRYDEAMGAITDIVHKHVEPGLSSKHEGVFSMINQYLFGAGGKKGHSQKIGHAFGEDGLSYRQRLQQKFPDKQVISDLLPHLHSHVFVDMVCLEVGASFPLKSLSTPGETD